MKIKSIVTILILTAVLMFGATLTVNAALCNESTENNLNRQNYAYWANPVRSYMTARDDGFMTIYLEPSSSVRIEYFDKDMKLVGADRVTYALRFFGGFYEDEDNYYILSGDINMEEDSSKEAFRLTRYDKNWNEIDHASLFGANTTRPFEAGSARFDSCGDYLLIRTCHEMYKHTDGNNHQANVTLEYSRLTGEFTDSFTEVMNKTYGYVSHSFNQFIKVDGNQIVGVDHGDAHPRSVSLIKYPTDCSTGKFRPNILNKCTCVDMLEISGVEGANSTGVSVGGFEIGADNYIVAGNTVAMGSGYNASGVRNVFVSVVPRDLNSDPVVKNLTEYTDQSASTPQMVKVSDSQFVVLWYYRGQVHYVVIDDAGNVLSSEEGGLAESVADSQGYGAFEGSLSDCAPVIIDGKIWWYAVGNNTKSFYEMDPAMGFACQTYTFTYGHDWVNTGQLGNDEQPRLVCRRCGLYQDSKLVTDFDPYWSTDGGKTFSPTWPGDITEGEILICSVDSMTPSNPDNAEFEYICSDNSVLKYQETVGNKGYLQAVGLGRAMVTVRVKYNPSVSYTYTVNVVEDLGDWKPAATSIRSLSRGKKYFKVTWKKKSSCTGYQIRYSTKSSLSDAKTWTTSKNTTLSKKVTGLKSKKKYYVQVRTYKKYGSRKYYSKWSSKKSIRTR